MLNLNNYQPALDFIGIIVAIGTAIGTFQQVFKNIKKTKEKESARILQEAKDEVLVHKIELENKIKQVESDLANLRENVEKDIIHLKETYNAEIKNLGQKIEDLRQDLKSQHNQLVNLLTKMIENKN